MARGPQEFSIPMTMTKVCALPVLVTAGIPVLEMPAAATTATEWLFGLVG